MSTLPPAYVAAPEYQSESNTEPVLATPYIDNEPGSLTLNSCEASKVLFQAIRESKCDLAQMLIAANVVSANTISCSGNTPLYEAVSKQDTRMVKQLIASGADLNGWSLAQAGNFNYGKCLGHEDRLATTAVLETRTPLMKAAEMGNLALVKLLVELEADDSLVAGDGQTALRLAANARHREIVAFLPGRRSGALKRIKYRHRKALGVIKAAGKRIYHFGKVVFFDVPKFFFWTIPKEVCLAIWSHPREIIQYFFVDLPKTLFWSLPKYLLKVLWSLVKALPRWIWRLLSVHIPAMVRGAWVFIRGLGRELGHVLLRLASAIHTVLLAVWTLLRKVTLRDVWNGFVDLLHSIFVKLPRSMWKLLGRIFSSFSRGLRLFFSCIAFILELLFGFITYVPRAILEIFRQVGAVLARIGKEVYVFFHPKGLV
ncbi:ankyrin repeat-containing domain protein [Mycena floridula]|nr:ankyrin repeat-containing domain protein [Mycena floridula]